MSVSPYRSKWKSAMTDRERFRKQMHFEQADRCFNMEFGYWIENFTQWPLFFQNNIRNESEANRFFSFDEIFSISGNIWMNPIFETKIIDETETTKIIINGDGLLAEIPKDSHNTIPRYIKASIVTPDDWKKVKEERFRRDDPDRIPNIGVLKQEHPGNRDYPLGVHCGSMIGAVRDLLTFEGLAYACYDYPDMVEDMVETCCVLVEDYLDRILPCFEFDFAEGWEDICYKNGPIVTVDFFKNVVMPRYKRISRKLRDAGIDLWYTDCDGDVRLILPYFLEGGINCLAPFEVNGCSHPSELLSEYEGELRIMGGFDKMQLGYGPAAIKAYMETLRPLVEKGGYIPFCDHKCPPNVNPDHYLYYLDLKEEMFGMN